MTLAFVVYLGLTLALTAIWVSPARMLDRGAAKQARYESNLAAAASIILFTALIGGRYNVGGDFSGYIDMYRSTWLGGSYQDVFFEPGFWFTIQFLKYFGMPDRSIVFFSSFMQIGLFSLWLRKHSQVAPFAVFGFMTLVLLDVNNIIRQGIAFFAVLLAISAIAERRWLTFLGWVLFAYMFHKSALTVLPVAGVVYGLPLLQSRLQASALIFSYAFTALLFAQVSDIFEIFAHAFGYSGYANTARSDLTFNKDGPSFNLGIYFWPIIDIMIIIYSKKLEFYYDKWKYRIYHNLFLLAALLQPVANSWDFVPFSRGLFYFVAMRSICAAFLMHYCLTVSSKPRDVVIGLGAAASFLAWFIVAIARGAAWSAPYQFY